VIDDDELAALEAREAPLEPRQPVEADDDRGNVVHDAACVSSHMSDGFKRSRPTLVA
jgi:hypothetical protein